MKILFLDIDGVLNSARSALAFNGYPYKPEQIHQFDMVAVGLIRLLCSGTETQICLSSVWRIDPDWRSIGRNLNLPIVDKTPVMPLSRGHEIQAWLLGKDNIDKWAIVDDDDDMLQEQKEHFIQTSSLEGLSYQNYIDLHAILK